MMFLVTRFVYEGQHPSTILPLVGITLLPAVVACYFLFIKSNAFPTVRHRLRYYLERVVVPSFLTWLILWPCLEVLKSQEAAWSSAEQFLAADIWAVAGFVGMLMAVLPLSRECFIRQSICEVLEIRGRLMLCKQWQQRDSLAIRLFLRGPLTSPQSILDWMKVNEKEAITFRLEGLRDLAQQHPNDGTWKHTVFDALQENGSLTELLPK